MGETVIKTLLILIPALPLAATLLTAGLGWWLLRRWSHWPTVIAIAPASPKARGIRGEVRMAQERNSEASSDLRAALRLEPQSVRWEMGLARILAEAGRLEAAEAAFRRVLAREPERADAHALLGATLARRGRSEEAIASYRRALALESSLRRALGERPWHR